MINQVGILPQRQFISTQGKYFTAQNATPGTGIAQSAAVAAFSDTTGFMVLYNSSPTLTVTLDFMKLILTAATTAVVSTDILVKTDTISRAPSTGSTGTLLTAYNTNSGSSTSAALQITAYNASGAMTIPASGTSSRTVARAHFATGLHVVGDIMTVQFGADIQPGAGGLSGATRTSSSAPAAFVAQATPVTIGPLGYAVVYRWSLTEAAAVTFEYAWGWTEG